MLKKDREAIAQILNNRYKVCWLDELYNTGYHEAIEDITVESADYIALDNPYFNKDKFIKSIIGD